MTPNREYIDMDGRTVDGPMARQGVEPMRFVPQGEGHLTQEERDFVQAQADDLSTIVVWSFADARDKESMLSSTRASGTTINMQQDDRYPGSERPLDEMFDLIVVPALRVFSLLQTSDGSPESRLERCQTRVQLAVSVCLIRWAA
jgi:hypothetical protein